ncbi:MAG: hypothetical protein IJT46_02920 [Bacteroidaceae bacterium]|nr:hypothetical protein [Bacteroidaceae bacterium]
MESGLTEKVSLKKLLGYGNLIESSTYSTLLGYMMQGAKTVNVPIGTIAELDRRKMAQKAGEKLMSKTATLNNKGIELEKAGKIRSAIKVYETNISLGYPAHHAYKRLMVLYHKAKDFENEARVIRKALDVFEKYPEYELRLQKLISDGKVLQDGD